MNNNVEGFTNREMINKEAAQWVLFLEETPKPSKEELAALNQWIKTSDIHRECLESMAQSWDEMDLLASVMLPQEMRNPSFIVRTFSASVSLLGTCGSSLVFFLKQLFKPLMLTSIAATAVFAIVFFVLQPQIETRPTELLTSVGESLHHEMPDGSTVSLNSSTHIQFSYSDNHRRIKLLSGEAHFDVAKDPSRPFEVYVNDRLVKAVGTAFSVYKKKDAIEVLVNEGTVELAIVDNSLVVIPDDSEQPLVVTENTNSSSLNIDSVKEKTVGATKVKRVLSTLSAGQRVTIPVQDEELLKIDELNTSEMTRFLSWKEGKLVFAGESLEEVIQEITRHTEVKIELDDPKLKSIRIGGQFQVGETDSLFYVLESGFGISVNRINEHHVKLYIK